MEYYIFGPSAELVELVPFIRGKKGTQFSEGKKGCRLNIDRRDKGGEKRYAATHWISAN
jgi:hypothetical protein